MSDAWWDRWGPLAVAVVWCMVGYKLRDFLRTTRLLADRVSRGGDPAPEVLLPLGAVEELHREARRIIQGEWSPESSGVDDAAG